MSLVLSAFSEAVGDILAEHGDSHIPLIRSGKCKPKPMSRIRQAAATDLFPSARHPEEAQGGLLLLLNCWEESHEVAQNCNTAEGSYWHGIAHRIEPDYSNAGYWFRRVGKHPIFAQLSEAANSILGSEVTKWRLRAEWDPIQFIDWCREAAEMPGAPEERVALRVQKAEWELLFAWCGAQIS